jgi:hypothetical protein
LFRHRTDARPRRASLARGCLRRAALLVVAAATFFAVIAPARRAEAFPWMIRHEYAGCIPCHADPSGSGLLTAYGRAQGELLLRTHYGAVKKGQEEEAGPAAGFLWFIKEPDWLLVGGSVREAVLTTIMEQAPAPGQPSVQNQFLPMQQDAKAQVMFGRFRASGSLGYAHEGAEQSQITSNTKNNLISRDYWAGVDLGDDKNMLLRAGRITVPYGIRQIEHTLWVRTATQSDIDNTQEVGVAFYYGSEKLRFEVMGIAGNYQINGDQYRQRGYAGYVELAASQRASIGLSSLTTYAKTDPLLGYGDVRMAHGAFARISPAPWLAMLAEADALVVVPTVTPTTPLDSKLGGVAMFQPIQGVHPVVTFEAEKLPQTAGVSLEAWAALCWFFAPHADIRIDFVQQWVSTGTTHTPGAALLPQLHVYL